MMLVTNNMFNGKLNLCNAHSTIGSRNFVQNAFLCSLGIQHADCMSNLHN